MPFQQKFRQSTEKETASGYSRSAPGSFHRSWPDTVAFREAIQHPETVFADPLLKQASVSLDRRGLPIAYTGRFAIVFQLLGSATDRWAVRCFTSGNDADERRSRYYLIARHIDDLGDIVVPFRYIDRGICVSGEWFPVLAMPWVPGEPLGRFVERNLRDPAALRTLAGVLTDLLLRLEAAGIAHGDWQHDNLLIGEGGEHVTLVDYDGMFVPEFTGRYCPEAGHPNYQHPGRASNYFGTGLDRFSCLVIQTALLALADDPDLWSRFSDGESLLFRKSDFLNPASSLLFATLRETTGRHEDTLLAELIACLQDACSSAVDATLQPVVPAIRGRPSAQRDVQCAAATPATTHSVAPWNVVSATGKKWWQSEKVALGAQERRLGAAHVPSRFPFIERLYLPETVAAQHRHLSAIRCGLAVVILVFSLEVVVWAMLPAEYKAARAVLTGVVTVLAYMCPVAFGSALSSWPRYAVYRQLQGELASMRGRRETLRNQRAASRRASQQILGVELPTSVGEYVTSCLANQPITKLRYAPYSLTESGYLALRRAGVKNASDVESVDSRTAVPGLSSIDLSIIHRWITDLATDAQVLYRRTGLGTAAPDLAGPRDNIPACDLEIARLQEELDAFPPVTFSTYLRLLFGLGEQADRQRRRAS
jgi:hypothetical protein